MTPPASIKTHLSNPPIHAMSMILNLARVPGPLGEELLKNPQSVFDVIHAEEEDDDDDGDGAAGHQSVDIDKAWHALHFLFTGTAWEGEMPASFLLVGGAPVGAP